MLALTNSENRVADGFVSWIEVYWLEREKLERSYVYLVTVLKAPH